jgi:hypothetical protein
MTARPRSHGALRITAIDDPVRELHYLNASPRGGGSDVARLPIALGARAGVGLTICGHDHWRAPLATHAAGQILNVDTRVVVLVAPRS